MKKFLNLERHQDAIISSKVTAILLKGWVSLTGGFSAGGGSAIDGATPFSFF